VRQQFPGEEILVITFARWEEGLVVAPGNPKRIRTAGDLVRKGVRFVGKVEQGLTGASAVGSLPDTSTTLTSPAWRVVIVALMIPKSYHRLN
jgi:accessory colonization factor AcfC